MSSSTVYLKPRDQKYLMASPKTMSRFSRVQVVFTVYKIGVSAKGRGLHSPSCGKETQP